MSWSKSQESMEIWEEYHRRVRLGPMAARVLFWSVLYYLAGLGLLAFCGLPFVPFRGDVAHTVNFWLLQAAVLAVILVIFTVLDATRMTASFVRRLLPSGLDPIGPENCLARIHLVAARTQPINTFIYYPAGLLMLLILARHSYFDNWDFPFGLIAVVGMSVLYVVISAIQLRQAAETARRHALRALSDQRRHQLRDKATDLTQYIIDEIKGLSEGAFVPITELPVFRAVTLPTGVYAVLTLVEALIKN